MSRYTLPFVVAGALMASSGDSAAETYREGLFGYDIADYATAHTAWAVCAEQGDYRCQFGLGILFNGGRGVPRDAVEAARWFRMAAESGSTDAALELGILYAIGPEGVEQDAIQAYAWLVVAARNGDPIAEERRALTRSVLDDEEVRAAEELATRLLNALRR